MHLRKQFHIFYEICKSFVCMMISKKGINGSRGVKFITREKCQTFKTFLESFVWLDTSGYKDFTFFFYKMLYTFSFYNTHFFQLKRPSGWNNCIEIKCFKGKSSPFHLNISQGRNIKALTLPNLNLHQIKINLSDTYAKINWRLGTT